MQIKIGFIHNAREIVLETKETQDELAKKIESFLGNAAGEETLTLESAKGARVILVREKVAYVELGSEAKNSVGFL